MVDFILAPVDGSEPSIAALEYALEIASDHGATVQLLYVADTNRPSLTQYKGTVIDALEQEGKDVLSDARELTEKRGVTVTDDVVQGNPKEAIVDAAASDLVDLVVMGTHGRGSLGKYVLGSVTEYVVNVSETPVMTVRPDEDAIQPYPYDSILVPTDGSDNARKALRLGATIATRHSAMLHLLSVVGEPALGTAVRSSPVIDRLEERARELLEEEATIAADAGVDDVDTTVEFGSVPEAVRSFAIETGVDLVIMGTHGRTGLAEQLLGTTTERVLRTAPVPVLTTGVADD